MNLAQKTRHCSRGLLILKSPTAAVRLPHCVLLSAKLALPGRAMTCRHSCRNQSKHLPASPRFPFLSGEFN